MNSISQQQYIAKWHDNFVGSIGSLLGVVAGLMARPEASEEDKKGLNGLELILRGGDVADVEWDLGAWIVRKGTLDKIEKLNKDLADICLEHIQMNPFMREFWKQLVHIMIERNKAGEQNRLAVMQISLVEG